MTDETPPKAFSIYLDHNISDDEFNDGAGPEASDLGYWMGLYAIPGVDIDKLIPDLDPALGRLPPHQVLFRPEGRVTSRETSLAEAARLHPMRCSRNTKLCRNMFLIADYEQYLEHGLLFVHIDWDEEIDGQNMASLAEKGARATIDTRRLPAQRHQVATLFNMVVKGYVQFKSTDPTFIFYDESHNYSSNSIRWLDNAAFKRKAGEEQFLEGSLIREVLGQQDESLSRWEQVIRRHPLQVYRERFSSTLKPQYFVFAEKEIKSKKDEVVLGQTQWSGDAWTLTDEERNGEKLPEGILKVTTMRCAASQAYKLLVDVVEGRKKWDPESKR